MASLASLIAAALLIVATAVYLGSVRQDTLQHENEKRVVTHSVDGLRRAVTATVRDYAWWNEAVRHLVLDLDEDWADVNIGPYIYSSFGYEVALVVDDKDHPVVGWLREAAGAGSAATALGTSLPLLLAEVRRRQKGTTPSPSAAFSPRMRDFWSPPPVRSCRSRIRTCRCPRAACHDGVRQTAGRRLSERHRYRLRLEPPRLRLG